MQVITWAYCIIAMSYLTLCNIKMRAPGAAQRTLSEKNGKKVVQSGALIDEELVSVV